ncbi:hypothetical protein WQ71_04845 [Escherichia coli]|uniref:hypothetical protein n=1 Tax=Escherichia coli TaxID=562 RepID=UPI00063D0B76|nr:hypothetical protein [Escherichia coli]KLH06829.1 hypothetical protein WQ71_04845 [Escherichia coli]
MKLVFVPLKDVFKECKGKRQFSIKKDAYRRFSSVSNEMQIGIKKIAALYAENFPFKKIGFPPLVGSVLIPTEIGKMMLWHHFFFLYQCSKINHHYAQPKLYSFSTICRC